MVLGFFGIQHFGQKKLKLNKIDWYVFSQKVNIF